MQAEAKQAEEKLVSLITQMQTCSGQQAPAFTRDMIDFLNNVERVLPLFLGNYMHRIAYLLMCSKLIQPVQKSEALEELMKFIITKSIQHKFTVGVQALRCLFDTTTEYYKHNLIDNQALYPLGRSMPIARHFPEVNEECDVVRPGLTASNHIGWARCKVASITKNNNQLVYSVVYPNIPDQVFNLDPIPWFAPLGTRCKDHDWRLGLRPGELIDAQDAKFIWYLSTVQEIAVENGSVKAKIGFRYQDPQGDKVMPDNITRYRGLDPLSDQWIQVTSSRIQRPHSMHKQICLYSSSAVNNEFFFDDSSDIIFEKQYQSSMLANQQNIYASTNPLVILRPNLYKSQTLVTLFTTFLNLGGLSLLNELVREDRIPIDLFSHLSVIIGNLSFTTLRMFSKVLYTEYVQNTVQYLLRNPKGITLMHWQNFYFSLNSVCRRVMTLSKKHDLIENIKRQLISHFISMNLDKQILSLRLLNDLIFPQRPHTPMSLNGLCKFIKENNIFYRILIPNVTHEQLLPKTRELVKYMMSVKGLFNEQELNHLWNLYPTTDTRNRPVLDSFIIQIIPNMNPIHALFFTKKILSSPDLSKLTIDNIKMLNGLREKLQGVGLLDVTEWLLKLIGAQDQLDLQPSILEEIEKAFKETAALINDYNLRFELLMHMLKRLRDCRSIKNEPTFIREFIATFPTEPPKGVIISSPCTIPQIIEWLKNDHFYDYLLGRLSECKNDGQTKQIINLLDYLVCNQKDDSQVAMTIERVYQKYGPIESILQWILGLSASKYNIVQGFYQTVFTSNRKPQKFSELTAGGLKSLKEMFLSYNSFRKNLTYENGKLYMRGPAGVEITQEKAFVFVSEPALIEGLQFLIDVAKNLNEANKKIYTQLIEFIVEIMTSNEAPDFERKSEFNQRYVKSIIEKLKPAKILSTGDIKNIVTYADILKGFIFVTENMPLGFYDLKPHIENIKGRLVKLRLENYIADSKKCQNTVELFVNQNISLWTLKNLVGPKFGLRPQDVSFMTTASVLLNEKQNGETLTGLGFFKYETLKVRGYLQSEIEYFALIVLPEKNRLTTRMQRVSDRWFSTLADANKRIGFEAFKNLYSACGMVSDQTIIDLFTKFGHTSVQGAGNKPYFTYEEFTKVIIDLCNNNAPGAWVLIRSSGYANDLSVTGSLSLDKHKREYTIRDFLSKDEYTQFFFDALRTECYVPESDRLKANDKIYEIICMLPSRPMVVDAVSNSFNCNLLQSFNNDYQNCYLLDVLLDVLEKSDTPYFEMVVDGALAYLSRKMKDMIRTDFNIYKLPLIQCQLWTKHLCLVSQIIAPSLVGDAFMDVLSSTSIYDLNMENLIKLLREGKPSNSQKSVERKKKLVEMQMEVQIPEELTAVLFYLMKNHQNNFELASLGELFMQAISAVCCLVSRKARLDLTLLENGLTHKSIDCRRLAMNLLFIQINGTPDANTFITNHLSKITSLTQQTTSNQFFDILVQLISENQLNQTIVSQSAQLVVEKILNYQGREKRNMYACQDRVLCGFIRVLCAILEREADLCSRLAIYKEPLTDKCLFIDTIKEKLESVPISQDQLIAETQSETIIPNYPICKNQTTRKYAMRLVQLLHLAQINSNNFDSDFVRNLIGKILRQLPLNLRRPHLKKLKVGLHNFGCTCYLNSIFQMLGNVSEPFRNGLVMLKSPATAKLIPELQKMYSFLRYSDRMDFVPDSILQGFQPPINKLVQQDATEFMTYLLDCLQREMKGTPYESLISDTFSGTTVLEMKCETCGHKRERQEEYFCYPVSVKGVKRLDKALEGMQTVEVIADHLCEECNNRGNLLKKTVFKKLPNTMFIHLQRIVFSLQTYTQQKINTRLEFPQTISMFPYTQDAGVECTPEMKKQKESDPNYRMNLKGIIVHSGGANAGHYIAILRQNNTWIKLDDSKVTLMTDKEVEDECFGTDVIDEWKVKNAYVLIYDREVKTPVSLSCQTPEALQHELAKFRELSLPLPVASAAKQCKLPFEKFTKYNTASLYKQVWLDNHYLMLETQLTSDTNSKNFIVFAEKLLQSSDLPETGDIVTRLIFRIGLNSYNMGNLVKFLEKYKPSQEIYMDIFNQGNQRLLDYLLFDMKEVRTAISQYLVFACEDILIRLSENYQLQEKVFSMLSFFLSMLNKDVAKRWEKADAFFLFWSQLFIKSVSIPRLYNWILDAHLISLFIDYVMEKESPLKLTPKTHTIGSKYTTFDFAEAVNTISNLVRKVKKN